MLPERLDVVAQTAYLAVSAGYAPGTWPDLLRAEASGEAIRLVCVVLGLRPDEPALVALLALMLVQHSRRDAPVRLLSTGPLAGPLTLRAAPYVLQARIAAEHALEGLEIPGSHRPDAVRAELLSRVGDVDAARAAYDQAIAACRNVVERSFLHARRGPRA